MKFIIKNKHCCLILKTAMFIITILIGQNTMAQTQYNLVKNSSFEVYITCPTSANHPPPYLGSQLVK